MELPAQAVSLLEQLGSGTTGEAAAKLDRDFILVDCLPEAIKVMKRRLAFASPEVIDFAKRQLGLQLETKEG